ncbi:MAG: DEAD/DEAH box helicase [Candidatus Thermoplasmatota archaeon]|nr:DEAD/DEAH box helicase [Euryarchaeota archaeon]MBU4032568.1 DEAD/DEAH box helicase [Candidatus Thermoplasmatota archaeon]MBU4072162.1 DEAD/DEAH box helicase [Candidatus Thermoplasmatota archaeon]MBU4144653.1 DEAD/DEAH box helicase [Candidatus Thermoplasmatota archaeon]MBU4592732.1 DEAD/DEAH box helicase [Candidatus Thermoplasmatota archaeon]
MNPFYSLDPRIREALAELGITSPSEAQKQLIPRLLKKEQVLLVAPTGIGKTEAAMLPIFHDILDSGAEGFYVLYITPLRALNRDMLRRLEWFGERLGITVGVRHGDTTQSERTKQSKKPPQILITTPETFQIMYTGKNLLRHLGNVRWVVVDEIHEMAQDERGAQLTVGMERLAEIVETPFVRVGLSATVGSPDEVALFLRGSSPAVDVINIAREKRMELNVSCPRASKSDVDLGIRIQADGESTARLRRCRDLIDGNTSTLLFVNTRNTAEVLAARFHLMDETYPVGVHHGSLSKQIRVQMEEEFKSGILKGLVCTSSLELGIDVGSADFTVQYNSPRQVTRLVQRIGRAGHTIKAISRGEIICDNPDDVLEAAVIARRSLAGEMEKSRIRKNPMSVLANQVIAAAMEGQDQNPDDFFRVVKRAYPFRDLDRESFDRVLRQLSDLRIIWLEPGRIGRSKNSRTHFFDNVSMIPDERTYKVIDLTTRRIIGTLDEGFVVSFAEPNAPFIVRGLPWRIVEMEEDSILVEPAKVLGAVPSWAGEDIPIPYGVAREVGRLRGNMDLENYPTNSDAENVVREYLGKQNADGIVMPTDNVITIETENRLMIINACLGSRINETLGKIIAALLMSRQGESLVVHTDAYRIILQLPRPLLPEAIQTILLKTAPGNVEALLRLYLKHSNYLRWKFIHVAKKFGAISKNADYRMINMDRVMDSLEGTPIMEEAIEKCLWELLDPEGAAGVLADIQAGKFQIKVSKISPIGKAGVENRGDIMMPSRPTHAILMAMKSRLEKESVALVCTHCKRKSIRLVGIIEEKTVCKACDSVMVAVVRKSEMGNIRLFSKPNPTTEEKKAMKKMMKSANLVMSHGKRAILALAARGVGPDMAARILAMHFEDEDEFLAQILTAEVTFARTKRFWD